MQLFGEHVRIEIQADTAYIVNSGQSAIRDDLELDSILSQYPVDTLYGEDAHLIFVQPSGSVSFVWVIVALVVIVLLAILIFMAIRTIKRQDRQCQDMMQEMRHLVQSNRSSCEAVAILIEERVRLMQSLVSHYKETASLPNKNMHLIDQVEYLKEVNNNYRKTLEVFNGDWSLLSKLEQALNAGKSNIMSRVRDIYGDTITENDYLILAGLFAGMSPATISLITGVKEGTIRVKKSRFIDRVEKLEQEEEKVLFLKELQKKRP